MLATLRNALETCVEKQLTFAAFRLPGEAVTIWAQRTPDLEYVDGSLMWELNDVFVIGPFQLTPERIAFIRSDVELTFFGMEPDLETIHTCEGTAARTLPGLNVTTPGQFGEQVARAQEAFAAKTLEKVVLSRIVDRDMQRAQLVELFLNGIEHNPDGFIALMHTPEHGFWLGASPERLVQEDDDHVCVDALAGTMATSMAPGEAGAWGEKERHEQEIVSRHVLRIIGQLGLQEVRMTGPDVMRAGEVSHLRAVFDAELGDRTLSDLVIALHPTPAICGTPTDAARTFILTNEEHDRSLYSGFWGPWKPDGRTDLYVNIRCLHYAGGVAHLFVGGGITPDSDAALEWAETEQKARTWGDLIARMHA